jgi:predicted HTH domain antitoxin
VIENEKRLLEAIQLYEADAVSLGRAALAAGLSKEDFMQALGDRGIPCIRYDADDLEGEASGFDR